MKLKRVMALALATAMVASVAGCAKVKSISNDDFNSACDKQGAEEVDYDEVGDDEDLLEDGYYTVVDADQIEEIMSDPYASMYMSQIDVPLDYDDIEIMSLFVKAEGFDDLSDIEDPEDLADAQCNVVIGMQITLTEEDMVSDLFDGIADALDDNLDYDVADFSNSEYYTGKNEGFIKINVSAQDLVAAFRESDIYGYLSDMGEDMDDLEDVLDNLNGSICIAIYAKDNNVVIVAGFCLGEELSLLDSFCSDLGVQSPSKVPSNAEFSQAIIDAVDDSLGSLMALSAAYTDN
ncbi:MAG: hypothetical protein J6127_03490 [Clostridiales bacterium]|nr:hypothetical protein [Clostridiales bacterium]